jgi:LuxR family transcriptional activator of conjugal transfer of Ti plasmids
LDQSRHCVDQASLVALLQKTMDELGFSRWAYQIPSNGQAETLIVHSYPTAWVSHYLDRGYSALDPVVTRGAGQTAPFRWSTIVDAAPLNAKEDAYYKEAHDFGLADGLGVPVLSRSGTASMFSMASDEKQQELDKRLSVYRFHLISIALAFDAVMDRLRRGERQVQNLVKLSGRERECLLWVMRGKSSRDIAQILSITERTVVFHIENAKKKLGVTTRSQAVVKAITEGHLTP